MEEKAVGIIEKQVIANIRKAIEKSGKSDIQIAYESGLGKGTISMIMNGKRSPGLRVLIRLAYGIECPLSDFFKEVE